MQTYDTAYRLAVEMKNSEVNQAYMAAKEKAFAEPLNKELYQKYRELTMQMNAAMMAGQEPTEEQKDSYQKLMAVLSLNADVMEFMLAEHRLNQMMGDVFKILADAVDLDLGFLQG